MIRSYVKIALRHLSKQLYASIVNIIGFALGLACALLTLLWIIHEYNYDRFHEDYKQIYRVTLDYSPPGRDWKLKSVMATLGPALAGAPELESHVRTTARIHQFPVNRFDQETFIHKVDVLFADSCFFQQFSFDLIEGDPKTVLNKPFTVVLTEEISNILFPDEDPIGKLLRIDGQTFIVTGIVKDPPSSTHFAFSIIASFETLYYYYYGNGLNSWLNFNCHLYVKIRNEVKPEDFIRRLNQTMASNINEEDQTYFNFFLQPLQHIHTDAFYAGGYKNNINRQRLWIFFLTSILLLIVALINYVVHTIACSSLRTKEIGVRKILGASRAVVIQQIIGEAIISTFIASILALSLIEILAPFFIRMFNATFLNVLPSLINLLIIGPTLIIIIGSIAGAYPALYLAKSHPARVMNRPMQAHVGHFPIRKILIIIQMFIAMGLITFTLIMSRQFNYIKTKELGFNIDNRIIIPFESEHLRQSYGTFSNSLKNLPGVLMVAGADKAPGANFSANPVRVEDYNETYTLHRHEIHTGYLELMGIEVVTGSGFDPLLTNDRNNVLVNQTFVNQFGWDNPIGKRIERHAVSYTVIGVVNDYHFSSLHEEIEPLILYLTDTPAWFIAILLEPGQKETALERTEMVWKEFFPQDPFYFYYLESAYDNHYREEEQFKTMMHFIASLISLIGIMGLFGLAHLDTKSRTKEIGIKKVFGASRNTIIVSFVKQYGLYVIIAACMSIPTTYLLVDRWLNIFAYRINIGNPLLYILPALIFFLITIITSSTHIIKVARTNPVEALRYE